MNAATDTIDPVPIRSRFSFRVAFRRVVYSILAAILILPIARYVMSRGRPQPISDLTFVREANVFGILNDQLYVSEIDKNHTALRVYTIPSAGGNHKLLFEDQIDGAQLSISLAAQSIVYKLIWSKTKPSTNLSSNIGAAGVALNPQNTPGSGASSPRTRPMSVVESPNSIPIMRPAEASEPPIIWPRRPRIGIRKKETPLPVGGGRPPGWVRLNVKPYRVEFRMVGLNGGHPRRIASDALPTVSPLRDWVASGDSLFYLREIFEKKPGSKDAPLSKLVKSTSAIRYSLASGKSEVCTSIDGGMNLITESSGKVWFIGSPRQRLGLISASNITNGKPTTTIHEYGSWQAPTIMGDRTYWICQDYIKLNPRYEAQTLVKSTLVSARLDGTDRQENMPLFVGGKRLRNIRGIFSAKGQLYSRLMETVSGADEDFPKQLSLCKIDVGPHSVVHKIAILPISTSGYTTTDGSYYYFSAREPRRAWMSWRQTEERFMLYRIPLGN